MKRTNENLLLCAMVFVVALVISNVVTGKTIQTGIPLFGSTIVLPGAALCYAITFLMTDVIGEVWGRKEAQTGQEHLHLRRGGVLAPRSWSRVTSRRWTSHAVRSPACA